MGQTQNTLPRFRTDYKAGDMPSAAEINALARLLNGAKAFGSAWIRLGPNGLHIGSSGTGFPWSKVAFGYSLAYDSDTSISTCTIYAGTLRIHGIGEVSLAETDVTLLSETCTVYVQVERGYTGSGGAILASASPSASNNSHYRFPLYTFAYDGTTGRHTLETIHHFGDIQLDTPVM